jgi:FdhE protein
MTRPRDRWSDRIARARELAHERPVVRDVLVFYADLAAFQQSLADRWPQVTPARAAGSPSFADLLDPAAAASLIPPLIAWLQSGSHTGVAGAVRDLGRTSAAAWEELIQSYWTGGGVGVDAGEVDLFVVETLLQPFAEVAADGRANPGDESSATAAARPGQSRCPTCRGLPIAAILRERGHGSPRSLVCGFCLSEWPALRIVCPSCGETGFDALPVYRAAELVGVRADACDNCGVYIKTIDATAGGAASPLVDDLASLPLDLWAVERGYRRMRPNLLRL